MECAYDKNKTCCPLCAAHATKKYYSKYFKVDTSVVYKCLRGDFTIRRDDANNPK